MKIRLSTHFFRFFPVKRVIHPSVSLLIFAISIILSDILVSLIRPTFFAGPYWLALALILLFFSIIVPRFPFILLAGLSGFLLISWRAGPDLLAQDFFKNSIGQNVTITGKITKDPTTSASEKLNITLTNLEISEQEISGQLFTQVDPKIDIQRSDTLTISGKLSEGFGNYSVSMFRPKIQKIDRPEPGDIFLKIRNFFADKVKDYIPAPQNGLALGYLLGQKSGVDKNFQDTLRVVGLTHIIVASGAHLSTLTGFARKIFKKVSRFAGFLAGILLTIFFIGITGLSASMMRAGLVTGISLLTKYFGREIKPLRLIILVAAATLVYNPAYLSDLAWLLSFASFTGILVLTPKISRFFYGKNKKTNVLSSTLISSVAASLLCTPILLYYFGQISLISTIANLLILPTVSFAMGLTFLTGLSAIILPPLANIFGYLSTILLGYQISVANFFGEQKMFLIQTEPNNPAVFALYIPFMIVFAIFACYSKCKLRLSRKNLAR